MKNKSILKVFGIITLVTVLLSWIIPGSTVDTTGVVAGAITPVGFADIFTSVEVLLYYFCQPALFILFVGMFYGVINKTGAFKAFVKEITSIFKNNKAIFTIITVLFYSVIAAINGIYIPLFIFVPMTIAIMLELKYNKLQAVLATVGAATIGYIAQISSNVIKTTTAVEANTFLWIKVGLLAVLVALTILYILKIDTKKEKTTKKEEISESLFIPEARDAKKGKNPKGIALFVVMILLFVVFILGLTPWTNSEIFNTVYTAIKGVKIGEFAIFDKLLGVFQTFGSWGYSSLYPTLGLAIIVVAISNKLSLGETIEACIKGGKKFVGLAILSSLLNIIVIFTLNSGFMATVINYLVKGKNIALITGASLISAPFMVDIAYVSQYSLSLILTITSASELKELYGLVAQVTYGLAMLIAPTSVLLMVGLSYVEESYSKWFKYIWKFLLAVLVACLIAVTVATIL